MSDYLLRQCDVPESPIFTPTMKRALVEVAIAARAFEEVVFTDSRHSERLRLRLALNTLDRAMITELTL